jgi:5-methylcytosine-specific restriction endonuclease McrA
MPTGVPADLTPKSGSCVQCAKEFEYVGRAGRKFCSRTCSVESRAASVRDSVRRAWAKNGAAYANSDARKEWLKANADRVREIKRRYYEANKARVIERAVASAAANPEATKAAKRKYNHTDNGRSVQLAGQHRRLARIKGGGGSHTAIQWMALREFYGNSCLCCDEAFAPDALTRDHVVPLAKGGTNDIGNIQPLCMDCNKRKGARIIDYRPDPVRLAA